MESYSVEAILSAVDRNFTSTMNEAQKSMGGLDKDTQKTNTSILDIAKGIGVFKLVDGAIGMVRNSVDGAIDRFDTLNKYPVVMQALGYSAGEVETSMDKLNKGIDGLPTSLNEIVSSTQQIAISTGSLDKGTDTAIALNNAFLASGASTADASRGMQQYVQMLSKGEADLQSWRSIQETMPVAMDKVAKSFQDRGVTSVNELYDALQDGDVTFEEFNSRLIELNDGVGGFAELAKKNSAGIKTSFSNIKTAVVKGVANVIQAIDAGMQDAGLGSIAENFDKIKGIVNDVFKVIVDNVPAVIKFITELANSIKPLLPLFVGLLAGFSAFSILNSIISTITTVKQVFTGFKAAITGVKLATDAAKKSQEAYNLIMSLNPTVIVIAAIVALVAGFIYLWNTSEDFRNFWIGLWEGIKQAVSDAVEWIKNAWKSVSDFFKGMWNGIKEGASNAVEGIKNAWNNVGDWFSGIWQGMKDGVSGFWQGIKDGAKKSVDSLKESWSNIKKWFEDTWQGIKDTVSKIVGDLVKAVMDRIGPLIYGIRNSFIHISLFLKTLWTNLVNIGKNLFTILKNVIMAPMLFVTSLISGGWEEAKNNMIAVWNNITQAAGEIWESITTVISSYLTNIKMVALNLWTGLKMSLSNLWNEISEIASNTWTAISDFFTGLWEGLVNGAIESWNRLKTSVVETWENMKQSAIDTFNAVVKFFKDSWELIKKTTFDTWENIKKSTVDAWNAIGEFLAGLWKGIVDGAIEAWENLKKSVSDTVEKVANIFEELRKIDLLEIGSNIVQGLVDGITEKWDALKQSVKDMAGGIKDWISDALDIHSPSRWMRDMVGKNIVLGVVKGIDAEQSILNKSINDLTDFSIDIPNANVGENFARVNSKIGTTVDHEVNYGINSKPAVFNVQLGNREFKAFVDDISQAQGNGIDINLQF